MPETCSTTHRLRRREVPQKQAHRAVLGTVIDLHSQALITLDHLRMGMTEAVAMPPGNQYPLGRQRADKSLG
ncbi:hypothetical protein D3C81_2052660 [compost metagenome]